MIEPSNDSRIFFANCSCAIV